MATLTIADLDNGKRDLQTVSEVANSRAATATTRFGQQTTTLYEAIRRINATGDAQLAAQQAAAAEIINELEADSDAQLAAQQAAAAEIIRNLGFLVPVPYAVGIEVTVPNFTVIEGGIVYAVQPNTIPFTTGAWDAAKWYPLQNTFDDQTILYFETLAAAEAVAASLPDQQRVSSPNAEGRQSDYRVESGTLVFEKYSESFPSVVGFGASADGTTDNTPAFSQAESLDVLKIIPALGGRYAFSAPMSRPSQGAFLPDPSLTWSRITDSGKFDWLRDFYTNKGATLNPLGASVWRFADRVLMGGAATQWAGDSGAADSGTSWLANSTKYPTYIGVNSQALMIAHTGKIAYGAAVRTSDNMSTHALGIGYGSAVINDKPGGAAWGGIHELQHEPGAAFTTGWELVCKNKSGLNPTLNPYYRALSLPSGGITGLWLVGGGDTAFGGSPTNPANSAIAVISNASSGANGCFNNGIIFAADALSGTDGNATSTGLGRAIVMARRHAVIWESPDGTGRGARLMSSVTTAASRVGIDFVDNGVNLIAGSSDTPMIKAIHVTSGVNHTESYTAISGANPKFKAAGPDANLDMVIEGKGSGGSQMRDGAGIQKVRVNTTGIGFFAATPVDRQSLGSSATDLASVIALANSIRQALFNFNLCKI